MEPVASQVPGQPQVMYSAPQVQQYSAPQVVSYQTMGAPSPVTYSAAPQMFTGSIAQPAQEVQQMAGQSVTYMQQPQVMYQPATYAQPQEPAGITYAAPPTVMQAPGQAYTMASQFAGLPSAPSMVAYPGIPAAAPYYPLCVQAAWDNHFAAFGAQDIDKILLDYDETSVVRVYDSSTGELTEHRGLLQVRELFAGLFRDLADLSTLKAPVTIVEEDYRQVFLVWTCPGQGVKLCSDTFLFGPDFKIKRQNITMEKQAGFVSQAINSVASTGAAAGAAAGAVGAAAAAAASPASAKASKKKEKGSKKKLSSKKKAKSGFC